MRNSELPEADQRAILRARLIESFQLVGIIDEAGVFVDPEITDEVLDRGAEILIRRCEADTDSHRAEHRNAQRRYLRRKSGQP